MQPSSEEPSLLSSGPHPMCTLGANHSSYFL